MTKSFIIASIAVLLSACTSPPVKSSEILTPPTHAYDYSYPDGSTVTRYGATYAEVCAYFAELKCDGASDDACVSDETTQCCGLGGCPDGISSAPSIEAWDATWESCDAELPEGDLCCDELTPHA